MFLLRYRRPHRYCDPAKLTVPIHPSGWEDTGPDPDEAIGALDFHLDDLVDEAGLPGAPAAGPGSIDGVNFVNFQLERPSGSGEGRSRGANPT